MTRFGNVHEFCYNSTESELIWMKFYDKKASVTKAHTHGIIFHFV